MLFAKLSVSAALLSDASLTLGLWLSLQAAGWRLLALVLLKALSMERLPQLRSSFEGPEALGRVAALLATDQLDLDHFSCLLELVLATD